MKALAFAEHQKRWALNILVSVKHLKVLSGTLALFIISRFSLPYKRFQLSRCWKCKRGTFNCNPELLHLQTLFCSVFSMYTMIVHSSDQSWSVSYWSKSNFLRDDVILFHLDYLVMMCQPCKLFVYPMNACLFLLCSDA